MKVEKYWIKEDVGIFDKESSRLHTRILGIAPMLSNQLNPDGSFRAVSPLFWVYYPDLRPMLAKFEAYNGKNFGARLSWEEMFESRMFASRIIKSTIENPNDQYIEWLYQRSHPAFAGRRQYQGKEYLITSRIFGPTK